MAQDKYTDNGVFDRLASGLSALRDEKNYRFAVVGGIPTDLMVNSIDVDATNSIIYTSPGAVENIQPYRPNGTIRDIDIKLFTDSQETIEEFAADYHAISQEVGSKLTLSVSGYELPKQTSREPWLLFTSKLYRDFTANTVSLVGGRVVESMPASTLENTWSVMTEGSDWKFPILAPPVHRGFYRTRLLSGDKAKDTSKLLLLDEVIDSFQLPEELAQLASTFNQFASRVKNEYDPIEALRAVRIRRLVQSLGIRAFSHMEQNEYLIRAVQDGDGLLGRLANRGMAREQKTLHTTQ